MTTTDNQEDFILDDENTEAEGTKIELDALADQSVFDRRLDQALAEMFPEYSRSKLKEWIIAGKVELDGQVQTSPKFKLNGTEHIHIEVMLAAQVSSQPEQMDLPIVFEDEQILVINKPAGLVVHPGAGNYTGTLLNGLLAHVPGIEDIPRAGIVHRLDKDTTGLMVVAKTLEAQHSLVAQLQVRDMSREYEAIVIGEMIAGGYVEEPIGRHPTKRTAMAVVPNGKEALTHYRIIEKFRAHTHLRLKLETGRTHQIRVHMSHRGYPLVGDLLYGGRNRLPKGASDEFIASLRSFNRQALHAAQLEFAHPTTHEWLSFQAPLPADMVELLTNIRQDTAEKGLF